MSVEAAASQFADLFTRFFANNPRSLLRSGVEFSDYDGPSVPESIAGLEFIETTIEPLVHGAKLVPLGRAVIGNLLGQLQNLNNTYTQLLNSRDQSSYQNFANAVDAANQQVRMYGLPFLASTGAELESQRQEYSRELIALVQHNKDLEQLKADVRTLISPAIAGTLSDAFRTRRDSIHSERMLWLILCIVLGGYATYATLDFVHALSGALTAAPATTPAQSFWPLLAVRTVLLIPIFAGFGFAFAQYRKERDFEEEYAHKAAVASSLPNYGDLAREQNMRDAIVNHATSVIFTSPSELARKNETTSAMLGGFKEVIEVLGKAVKKQ